MKKNISEKELQEAYKITLKARSEYSLKELEANFNRAFDELSYKEQKAFYNSMREHEKPIRDFDRTLRIINIVAIILIVIVFIFNVTIFFDSISNNITLTPQNFNYHNWSK